MNVSQNEREGIYLIAEMYKRREKFGYIFLGIILLIILLWTLFNTPEAQVEWLEMLFFLFPIGLIVVVISRSRSHFNKVKDMAIVNSSQEIIDVDHVVIKKDVSFTPRLLLFEKEGNFIGMMKPLNIPWWMHPFQLFNESMLELFPLRYGFIDSNGEVKFTFHKQGWLKQVNLTIFDKENKEIGKYIQEEMKTLFQIKGNLFNEEGVSLLNIKASGFSGSFSWNDEGDKQWAYFYNGKFPHENTDLFRDTKNDIVELSNTLSKENKIRLLSVIGYLFMTRIRQ